MPAAFTGPVQIYRSTDTGAPLINVRAGSYVTLLDAVLVNGYNEKTVTATGVAGDTSTVTITDTAHGRLNGEWITLSGASNANLNGVFKITFTGINTYTIKVSAAGGFAGSASGLKAKKMPCGWKMGFTDTTTVGVQGETTKRSYISPNLKRYVEINDTGSSTSHLITSCSFAIYSTCTAYGVGTDKIALPGSLYKAYVYNNANGPVPVGNFEEACHWMIISNGRFVVFFNSYSARDRQAFASNIFNVSFFGEFSSVSALDQYNFVMGIAQDATYNGTSGCAAVSPDLSAKANMHVLRTLDQALAQPSMQYLVDYQKCQMPNFPTTCLAYPDVETRGAVLQRANLWEKDALCKRGWLPGMWFPTQKTKTALGASAVLTVSSGELEGKKFLLVPIGPTVESHIFIEISDTWE